MNGTLNISDKPLWFGVDGSVKFYIKWENGLLGLYNHDGKQLAWADYNGTRVGDADTLDGKHAEDFKILTIVDNNAEVTCIEARQDNTVIRLQIQTNMEIARFFKSTDGGASWTEMPLGAATNVGIYTEAKLAALEARIAALEGGTT